MLAIVGPSGAGKSTLLHILGALDRPSSGTAYCASTRLGSLRPDRRPLFATGRSVTSGNSTICYPNLPLSRMSACRCWRAARAGQRQSKARRNGWTKSNFPTAATHRAGELSGGEQQRVSLARALVTEPKVLLADEPTGDLDGRTADVVFSLIQRLHHSHGLTSSDRYSQPGNSRRCSRLLRLDKGRLEELSPASGVPSFT